MDGLPKIGLGTWQMKPEICKKSVLSAIKLGYRLIDTAQAYQNELAVGEAISNALSQKIVSRDELIIATKLFPLNNRASRIAKSVEKSLRKLQIKTIDILYIHFPKLGYHASTTLKEMGKLVDEGKVDQIAVCNFTIPLLEEALLVTDKPLLGNQIEHHPLLQQKRLQEFLKQHKLKLFAYSPLGHGNIMDIPELKEIAQKHSISVAQVCLAWEINHNAIPIPKSTSEIHLKDNLEAMNIHLDLEDIQKIESIQTQKRFVNPPFASPKWDV